jgi:ParB family transcriptional regulator, chromosome partitioning protein
MASFKQDMRAHVAGSMNDRTKEKPGADFTVNQAGAAPARSALERQKDGRRRLDEACQLRLDRIVPDPRQPRTEFDPDALARLADSLTQRGQLQPIRVRWDDATDRYIVIVGERRYRAAKLAGLPTITCIVTMDDASPQDLLEDQLVENALREDLKPIEQARAYRSLLTARGLTQRQLAERLQIGHASITRALALLSLPRTIRDDVEAGKIAPNTAYELSKVDNPGRQLTLAREAASGRLRRDELRELTGASKQVKGMSNLPGPKVFRTPAGRVTVEPNSAGVESIRSALADAMAQLGAATSEA